jgi:hypothetical protein
MLNRRHTTYECNEIPEIDSQIISPGFTPPTRYFVTFMHSFIFIAFCVAKSRANSLNVPLPHRSIPDVKITVEVGHIMS